MKNSVNKSKYQICTRCVMDNMSDDTITFLEDGTCNYCNETLKRLPVEYFPNQEGKIKLDAIMDKIKKDGKKKDFDCIVGVSGGIDSSYVLYLGHLYGLRMLAIHVDDGLDTETAKTNILNLCNKTKTEPIIIKPDIEQYKDLTLAFFKAKVPDLAIPQDNILLKALIEASKTHKISYSLSGLNFSMESIMERSSGINACDKKHILAVHKLFGNKPIDNLKLISFTEKYLFSKYNPNYRIIKPLNYINYNLKDVLSTLYNFSNYNYYGGKHYESILCRFIQAWYKPVKYNFDIRKSFLSSLIVSGQMTRDESLNQLSKPAYISEELKEQDFNFLSEYLGITRYEFDMIVMSNSKQHSDYPTSWLNRTACIARKFRRWLG